MTKFLGRLIIFIFFICCWTKLYSFESAPSKKEIDSIKTLIKNCKSDTCVFGILYSQYNKLGSNDPQFSAFYGNWIYECLKNTSNPLILSDALHIKGILMLDDNKLDSAIHYFKEALRISKDIRYYKRIAWSQLHLGHIEARLGNSRHAVNYYLQAMRSFTFNKDKDLIFETKFFELIGESYRMLNQYDSALFYYKKKLDQDIKNRDEKSEVYTFLNISSCYKSLNNIRNSTEYLNKALKKVEKINDEDGLTAVYTQIGQIFFEQKNNYTIARDYYLRALEIAQKKNLSKRISALYSCLSKTYFEEGKYNLALEYNRKSLAISKKINYRHALADSYENIGYTYKKMGNNPLALEYFKKCWETQCDFCPPITFHKILVEIGDIFMNEKKYNEALKWYMKSIELAENSNAKSEIAKSKLRIGIINFYGIQDFKLAEKYILESFKLANEVKNFLLIKNICDTISKFYFQKMDYKSALDYVNIAREMEDILSKSERQASMAELEMNFELEKLKKESEAKETKVIEEKRKQKIYLVFLLLILFLSGSLGFVIFKSLRRKNRDNRLLVIQKNEIAHQKDELVKMSNQLHEADQLKINFFTNISHELRTPLTLILSPLSKLIKDNKYSELKETFSLIVRNTKKLQTLINQLLDISKFDKGELKLNLKAHNFNKHVRTIASMFQSLAEEKNILFTIVDKRKEIIFSYDSERIEQVLNNLISNAFKFTKEGGKITLCLGFFAGNDEYIEIKISDNGIGIQADSLDKVFDRFFQCENSAVQNTGGSGIGLSLVKEIVELHGGKISVKSEYGKWTEFAVLLPYIKGSENLTEEFSEYQINNNDQIQNKPNNLPAKVLVVEDNNDLRGYLSEIISPHCTVITAVNGSEGVKMALKKMPDIIVSDIMMPGIDGYKLTSKIKGSIETSHIPIILLTAKAMQEDKIEGLEKGADDYLIKPFDTDELLLKIKNILNNKRIIQEKYRKQIIMNPSSVDVLSLDEQFLQEVTSIIEKEISNNQLDVDFLCNAMKMSRSQIFRKIKALTDLSINHFIRSIRLKRAAELLKKKAGSVSEIAYMTGFESIPYFTTKFKEEFGKTPSEY